MPSQQKNLLIAIVCIFAAMFTIQTGSTFAKQLFPVAGPLGTSALRITFSALVLWLVFQPWRRLPKASDWRSLIIYGLCLAGMKILFYLAIERIPIGIAVALEFTGPLTVAMLTMRRMRDSIWVFMAFGGILLLVPDLQGAHALDPVGIAYAVAASTCWGGYILFGKKAGDLAPGGTTVAWGMLVAAMVALPVGITTTSIDVFTPHILLLGCILGIISSALPYTLEMVALKNMPQQTFSILASLEPAVAALAGYVFLHELLSITQWAAILLVITASVGNTVCTASYMKRTQAQGEPA
ncbi:DMT family transporter [Parasalinivibrio latis]|uniref:EamA family transporter n=1 Tax=Parasalinivibrio latis TaxID=2952610 RepID=UPI0030E563DB